RIRPGGRESGIGDDGGVVSAAGAVSSGDAGDTVVVAPCTPGTAVADTVDAVSDAGDVVSDAGGTVGVMAPRPCIAAGVAAAAGAAGARRARRRVISPDRRLSAPRDSGAAPDRLVSSAWAGGRSAERPGSGWMTWWACAALIAPPRVRRRVRTETTVASRSPADRRRMAFCGQPDHRVDATYRKRRTAVDITANPRRK